MASLIFPNFPKCPRTGTPVIPELPAAPIRGGGNGNGIPSGANNLPLLVRVPVLALTSERWNHD